MSKSTIYIIGIVMIVGILGGIYYWFGTTTATQSEIDAKATDIPEVDSKVLQNKTINIIDQKQVPANVPITVEEYDNDNLFK